MMKVFVQMQKRHPHQKVTRANWSVRFSVQVSFGPFHPKLDWIFGAWPLNKPRHAIEGLNTESKARRKNTLNCSSFCSNPGLYH